MGQNNAAFVAHDSSNALKLLNVDAAGNLLTAKAGNLPSGATPVTNSSGNVAASPAVATLPAVVGKTNYVTGFSITGAGATGASVVTATLAGLLGGTASYTVAVPAGATTAITPLNFNFDNPLAMSAADIAAVLTLPSLGAGNTNATVSLYGYVA